MDQLALESRPGAASFTRVISLVPACVDGDPYKTVTRESVMANLLQPGCKAPCSGLFKVIHAQQHAPEHYVTVIYGETLPPCKECLLEVRFEAAISAVNMITHPFFKSDR